MRKAALLILFQAFWMAGFSQSLPPTFNRGVYFQRTNLVVRWKAPNHPWPKTLWLYQMVPTKYSPMVISNLMTLGSFTERDTRFNNSNGIGFSDPPRSLAISFSTGEISFSDEHNYGVTNLAKDVPTTNQLFHLMTNFIPKLGINLSEIAKGKNGQPEVNFTEPFTEYYANGTFITNVQWRGIHFNRAIDGIKFLFAGGDGEINFGEQGKVVKIRTLWPSLERDKSYSAATPKKIIQWIHEGRAIQKRMLQPYGGETVIDWSTVKNLTIKEAKAYYDADFFVGERMHQPIFPSWVHPYAELWGTVDTGTTNIDVEILCPIIDETKQ